MTDTVEFYNVIAGHYGEGWTIEEENRIAAGRAARGSERILEVACGNGWTLAEIAEASRRRAVGVDFSERMLAEAGRRAPQALLVCARGEALPFRPGVFDTVISVNGLHNQPELRRWVRAMARLRPERLILDYRNRWNPMMRRRARQFRAACRGWGVDYRPRRFGDVQQALQASGYTTTRRQAIGRPYADCRDGFRWRHVADNWFSRLPGLAPTYLVEARPE